MLNPFDRITGANRLTSPVYFLSFFSLVGFSAVVIGKMGIISALLLIIMPFGLAFMYLLFKYPFIGLYTALFLDFTILGLSRYIDFQVGLLMDGILFLTLIALIFNRFYEKIDWSLANKDVTFLAIIWVGYSFFELVNPEAHSFAASINGFRGVALYMLMTIVFTLLFFDTKQKIDIFLYMWGVLSLLATFKGMMQQFIGCDSYEQLWLDQGGAITHVLFGKLRIFSFMSDAGQFGANQAYSAVVAGIIAIAETNIRKKSFFTIVAVMGIYGMLLSGTRGAISVPFAGFGTYFVLKKNKAVMAAGFVMIIVMFVFFKYTKIANNVDQVRRMRTAFDPNDASLQVRLENQRTLSVYLASRPLGGGLGHAGVKAKKYLPNAFLSNVATDSWYVMIWAEMGVIGLLLHLGILFYIMIKSSYNVMFRIRDPIFKMKIAALTSGMAGVMVASYGNAVLGSMPTGLLIYISMAIMLNAEKYDTPLPEEGKKEDTDNRLITKAIDYGPFIKI
ncbi:MAG: O-antigen ligase family protein [Mariniphaga sp.]